MNKFPLLLALALPAIAGAQSPLSTIQTTYPTGTTYLWTGCASPNLFFNLVVNTPITIQGLDCVMYRPGLPGTVEVWITNPGITTYVGNELNAAAWTMGSSGPITSLGVGQAARVTLAAGITLQPNTYGVAIHYIGAGPLFWLGNGTVVPGGGGPTTNQTYSNAELTLLAGNTQPFLFGAAPQPLPYVWLGAIHYALGAVPHVPATNIKYGSGCYTNSATFYQRFPCSGPAPTTLNGRSLTMLFIGNGYAVTPGGGTYIPPTGAAAALPATDDGEVPIALTNPMVYPGGATQSLYVNMNGIISVAPNTVPNLRFPTIGAVLDVPQMAWFSWHDYTPTEAGSGVVKFEELGSLAVFTWEDVESRPATAVNRCTFQMQFDTATGNVTYVWQTMGSATGSNTSDDHIIGFSPGGPSPDLGPIDIATFLGSVLIAPEVLPLRLEASPSPVLGTTVNYTTSNETSLNVGILFLSVASLPGIDLGFIGAPGCAANVDITQAVGSVVSNLGLPGLSMTIPLPIPLQTNLLGFQLFGQTVWLDAAANPFGILVSNGVRTTLGSF